MHFHKPKLLGVFGGLSIDEVDEISAVYLGLACGVLRIIDQFHDTFHCRI
jgi:hypothetical protein